MLEYEMKVLLSYDEYSILSETFQKITPNVTQTNYYYDTNDFKLNELGITCRIREKNGKYEATIKDHSFAPNKCSIEHSKTVCSQYDDSLFKNMDTRLHGKLVTERVTIYSNNKSEIVLDKNTYLGVSDYELEIEYSPEQEEYAKHLLRYIARILCCYHCQTDSDEFYNRTNISKSKSERFFERKKMLSLMQNS